MSGGVLLDFPLPTQKQLELLKAEDDEQFEELTKSLADLARDEERELYEGSLIEFFKRAWPEMGEAGELSINWHHEVIAAHLEAIAWGEIRHLIINIPPRHTKTLLTNVCFPAWCWANPRRARLLGPHVKFLSVSYGSKLAEKVAAKMRQLVMGHWYQSLWGDRVQLRPEQSSRADFANMAGGERFSASVEGGILGSGGDIQVIDDPQTRRAANSELERTSSLQAMSDLTTRITDPRISAKVLIMQRLHEADATNWALDNWPSDTVHLMFPARFEADRAVPQDIRTAEGQLLWPEVWTETELRKIEQGLVGVDAESEGGLSSYDVAGQLQQRPAPRGGGIVGANDWAVYPEVVPRPEDMLRLPNGQAVVPLPPLSFVIVALDTATSERESADWNACAVWGIWHRRRNIVSQVNPHAQRWAARMTVDDALTRVVEEDEQPRAILMEAWRRRCRLNDETIGPDGRPMGLVQRVIDTARRRKADVVLIEDKTRGTDVANEIRRQLNEASLRIEMFNPNRHGDKVTRLNSVQSLFAQQLIYAPANCVTAVDHLGREIVDVQEFMWVNAVRNEVASFPRAKHDDFVDVTSMPLIWLRENHFLRLTDEFIRDALAARLFEQDRERPSRVVEHYLGA